MSEAQGCVTLKCVYSNFSNWHIVLYIMALSFVTLMLLLVNCSVSDGGSGPSGIWLNFSHTAFLFSKSNTDLRSLLRLVNMYSILYMHVNGTLIPRLKLCCVGIPYTA